MYTGAGVALILLSEGERMTIVASMKVMLKADNSYLGNADIRCLWMQKINFSVNGLPVTLVVSSGYCTTSGYSGYVPL